MDLTNRESNQREHHQWQRVHNNHGRNSATDVFPQQTARNEEDGSTRGTHRHGQDFDHKKLSTKAT